MGKRFQSFQRKRQVGATFVVGYCVDLIYDHSLDIAQNGATLPRCKQNVE